MENNKQSLQLSRTALTITLFIWFVLITIGSIFLFYLQSIFSLYLIPTILNIIIISFKKLYKKSMILITILSYIIFVGIAISMVPEIFYIIAILFLPQTIFLILACLTFKKIEKKVSIKNKLEEFHNEKQQFTLSFN